MSSCLPSSCLSKRTLDFKHGSSSAQSGGTLLSAVYPHSQFMQSSEETGGMTGLSLHELSSIYSF